MNKANSRDKVFITNSFKETRRLGKDFARTLSKGDMVCLYGDLGAGKTTFVQGMAEGLGIKKRIISPTFIIVRNYRIMNHESPLRQGFEGQARIMNFYHIDLYRTESAKDIEGLGLEEILNEPENIVVIEWAEKMGKLLPKERIDVKFEYLETDRRRIAIEKI